MRSGCLALAQAVGLSTTDFSAETSRQGHCALGQRSRPRWRHKTLNRCSDIDKPHAVSCHTQSPSVSRRWLNIASQRCCSVSEAGEYRAAANPLGGWWDHGDVSGHSSSVTRVIRSAPARQVGPGDAREQDAAELGGFALRRWPDHHASQHTPRPVRTACGPWSGVHRGSAKSRSPRCPRNFKQTVGGVGWDTSRVATDSDGN